MSVPGRWGAQRRPRRNAPEASYQAAIVDLAHRLGYRAFHVHDSRRSESGWPDLVLASVRRRRVVFAELKSERGVVSAKQEWWMRALRVAGLEVHLWRKGEDTLEEIAGVLTEDR